jgi:hypothetical protein
MTYPDLEGLRYLCLVRCSSAKQADTSIPDQLKLLKAFADENGMIHAEGDDVVLPNVSGSTPGARRTLTTLSSASASAMTSTFFWFRTCRA